MSLTAGILICRSDEVFGGGEVGLAMGRALSKKTTLLRLDTRGDAAFIQLGRFK